MGPRLDVDALIAVAVGFAVAGAVTGCGGRHARAPDATPMSDAPELDTLDIDAPLPDTPDIGTAITIRTFPDGVPSPTGVTENATFIAFQDGDQPWVALTGDAGVYHVTATAQRYSVAVGCVGIPTPIALRLYYWAVSDGTVLSIAGCSRPSTDLVHVTVDLQGLPSGAASQVWLGRSLGLSFFGVPIMFDAHKGTVGVLARSSLQDATGAETDVRLYRGAPLDLQSDETLQIDMGLARPAEPHPLTLIGARPPESPEETILMGSTVVTTNSYGEWRVASQDFNWPSTALPDHYTTLDPTMRHADDVTQVTVLGFGTTVDGRSYVRDARLAFKDLVAQTIEVPAIATADAPRVEEVAGVPRVTVTLPTPPSTLGFGSYEADLRSGRATPTQRTWILLVSAGWAGDQRSVTITTPDLTHLAGWQAEMGFVPGAPVDGDIGWVDRNMPAGTPVIDGRRIVHSFVTRP